MNFTKTQLFTLLSDLRNTPHCIIPKYANALEQNIQSYLDKKMEFEETTEEHNSLYENENGVGIIDITGVIVKRIGLPSTVLEFLGLVDLDNVDEALRAVKEDPQVHSVILNVNSPGGFISGLKSTAILVDDLSKEKEVVVYTDLINGSAAYEISSQASSIVASVDATMGSVGVYLTVEDWSKALENEGVKVHLIKSGNFKAIGLPSQQLTDEQKQYLQENVNALHQEFKETVKKKRKIKDEDMEGQVFSGKEALAKGFIDDVSQDISEVIKLLQK